MDRSVNLRTPLSGLWTRVLVTLLILAGVTAAHHPSRSSPHRGTDILFTVQATAACAADGTASHTEGTEDTTADGQVSPAPELGHPCPQAAAPPQPGRLIPALAATTIGAPPRGQPRLRGHTRHLAVPRDVLLLNSVCRV
jgi:hypothetical protein